MSQIIDLTGRKFGRWLVKAFSHQKDKAVFWECHCECGTVRPVFGGDLKRGGSLSCGCLMREVNGNRRRKHNHSFHPAYRSWVEMKVRCNNPTNSGYKLYGGRGISVCASWATFEGFWQDMGPSWQAGLSLDRIDVNGNYEPNNCRWATAKEQANNRRTNIIIKTPEGPMTIALASERFGIKYQTIRSRMRYGWKEEDLLSD